MHVVFTRSLMLTHAREIQNEVKQKREKIFEFFGLKKKNSTRAVV